MIEAVIFDMDGVIIDSEPIYYQVTQRIFKSFGLEIPEAEYSSFVGITDFDMWSFLKHKYGLTQTIPDLLQLQAGENIKHLGTVNLEPISGIVALLDRMVERKIRLGLASSSPGKVIELVLKKCGVNGYFETVVSGENVKRGKPAPDIFLSAAERLGVEPHQCVVIEDSAKGVQAAKAAGMMCIGFKNPNSYHQDLSGADWVVGDFEMAFFDRLMII
jgi:beta-phosphoglucomutase family hydrolase